MTKFFVGLYNYFERHKVLFYLSLSVCILFMALFAAQVRFEENVTSFFPDTKDSQNAINVFENLKIKDKIMIMLSGKDGVADADSLIEAAETIKQDLQQQAEGTLIKEIFSKADENLINSAGDFVYDNLPLFLSDEDYQRLDTLLTAGNIAALMQKNYSNLISPAGFALKNYLMRDPLGLGSQTLKHLQDFQLEANYELINEHIFSRDGSTLLMFITPVFNTGSTGKNDKLIRLIEDELQKAEKEHPQLVAEYFGGPSVGVYNARQIKKDTLVTSSIALIIIIVFISLVFKHKKSIPLIITPVLFGALFALCLIYFIKGGISAIAVGAGSAVMGIALSYSIHMLAHQNHVSSVQQLIREIAYPLTIGSFTTIGAFFGLLFTSSNLLRDFGLFASLALIGTTLFCLVYLPHFLKGQAHVKQGAVLRFIEKLNAYPYEKNKGLVGGILVLTIICLFTSQNVRFNEDMMSLNYEPAHLKQSENKLAELFDKKEKTVNKDANGKKEIRNRHGVNKAQMGHFAKAGVSGKRFVREFKFENADEYKLADEIKADIFAEGDKVDVTAISKGKGFQGAIKRLGQHRGPMAHGSKFHRHQGSNGACSSPSKVFKGKGMPGHMGSVKVTTQNLEVVRVDADKNLLLIKGAVPGAKKALITVKETTKSGK